MGTTSVFCPYVYHGDPNVCANASNVIFFAWNFKIAYAILIDTNRPFGMRRRPWMIFGWVGVLVILFVLYLMGSSLQADIWLTFLLLTQVMMMFADVAADGYSVELGHLEPPEQRGQILATGQRIRFTFCIVASLMQTFLLNGVSTGPPNCQIGFDSCWAWGLSVDQFYGLLFFMTLILTAPVVWLQELTSTMASTHSLQFYFSEIWETMQNQTFMYLMIFVVGVGALANYSIVVNYYMQYYIINLTNFQSGIDGTTSYIALVFGIWLFQTYLINLNWRTTNYLSNIFGSLMLLLWIPAYYDLWGLQNAWYTIFIDLDASFIYGISQVLFSLSVIEISKPGQEATTYELITTASNAASTVSSIIATQLLTPFDAVGCENVNGTCPANQVDIVDGRQGFNSSHGPRRFTIYACSLIAASILFTLVFTPFLPRDREECRKWREEGIRKGAQVLNGIVSSSLGFAVTVVIPVSSLSSEKKTYLTAPFIYLFIL